MHSKVIIASLACVLAASFANSRTTNISVNAQQSRAEQATCCKAPNEDGINAVLYADKPYQSNDFCLFLQGLEYQSEMASHMDLIHKSPELRIYPLGYSPVYGYYYNVSQPNSDGDYFATFGIGQKEVATIYIYRKNGVCYGSTLSKFDARARFYKHEVATSSELSYYPLNWGESYSLNSTAAINAVKHYGTYVYNGTSDILTTFSTTQKSWNDFGSNLSIKVHVEMYKNGTFYPVESARVRLFASGSEYATGIRRTNSSGNYTFTMNFNDTFNKTLSNLQLGLFSDTAQAMIRDNSGLDNPYFFSTTSSTNLFMLKTIQYNIKIYPERSDRAAAYEISQAEMVPYKYTNYYSGSSVSAAKILFPAEKTSYYTSFDNNVGVCANNLITIRKAHSNVWDVMNHEYGHYISDMLNLSMDPSNDIYWTHTYNEDLIHTYDFTNGRRIAYSEGLATYLAVASQMDYATRVNSSSYCATIADEKYIDPVNDVYADFGEYRYGLTDGFCGQGVESSIPSAMIKFLDNVNRTNDNVALGHQSMWNAIRAAGSNTCDILSFDDVLVGQNPTQLYAIYAILDDEVIPHPTAPTPPVAGDDWTILIYMCGSSLESSGGGNATYDIEEMLSVPNQPDGVNIVIQTGGSADGWGAPDGVQIPANRISRQQIRNQHLVECCPSLPNASMGDEGTLYNFLVWGLETFPAQKTGLILWNHGDGFDGVCYDQNYPVTYDPAYELQPTYDSLLNSEVAGAVYCALDDTGVSKMDFIGYDACLMQLQDVADFNSSFFNYMIASTLPTIVGGWKYNEWLPTLYNYSNIRNHPSLYPDGETVTILKRIADTFVVDNGYGKEQTLSILNLSEMINYRIAFENLAQIIKNKIQNGAFSLGYIKDLIDSVVDIDDEHKYGQTDCYHFLQRLKEDSSYNHISTDAINDVLKFFPTNYTTGPDPLDPSHYSGMASGDKLVIYWRATIGASGSYPITRGLALHFVCDYGETYGAKTYSSGETGFNTWRSLWLQSTNISVKMHKQKRRTCFTACPSFSFA